MLSIFSIISSIVIVIIVVVIIIMMIQADHNHHHNDDTGGARGRMERKRSRVELKSWETEVCSSLSSPASSPLLSSVPSPVSSSVSSPLSSPVSISFFTDHFTPRKALAELEAQLVLASPHLLFQVGSSWSIFFCWLFFRLAVWLVVGKFVSWFVVWLQLVDFHVGWFVGCLVVGEFVSWIVVWLQLVEFSCWLVSLLF